MDRQTHTGSIDETERITAAAHSSVLIKPCKILPLDFDSVLAFMSN